MPNELTLLYTWCKIICIITNKNSTLSKRPSFSKGVARENTTCHYDDTYVRVTGDYVASLRSLSTIRVIRLQIPRPSGTPFEKEGFGSTVSALFFFL